MLVIVRYGLVSHPLAVFVACTASTLVQPRLNCQDILYLYIIFEYIMPLLVHESVVSAIFSPMCRILI